MIDTDKKIFNSANLIEINNNYLWTKLYHGIMTQDVIIYINDVNQIDSIINTIKNLPRNLNGFSLTLNVYADVSRTIDLWEFKNGKINLKFNKLITNLKFNFKNCNVKITITTNTDSNSDYISSILTFDNCYLIIINNSKFNGQLILNRVKLIADNSTFTVNNSPIISANISEIYISETCQLLKVNDSAETPITELLSTDFYFNECQATIIPQYLNEKISEVYNNYNEQSSWSTFYTDIYNNTDENNILAFTSGMQNINNYNFINHIHTSHYFNNDFENTIPSGTLILFPMCFKASISGKATNPTLSALMEIPSGWKCKHSVSEYHLYNWIETNKLSGQHELVIENNDNISDIVSYISGRLSNIFIYQYRPLDFTKFLNQSAQFTLRLTSNSLQRIFRSNPTDATSWKFGVAYGTSGYEWYWKGIEFQFETNSLMLQDFFKSCDLTFNNDSILEPNAIYYHLYTGQVGSTTDSARNRNTC